MWTYMGWNKYCCLICIPTKNCIGKHLLAESTANLVAMITSAIYRYFTGILKLYWCLGLITSRAIIEIFNNPWLIF